MRETLRPMMPASPTPRSKVCGSCVTGVDPLPSEKEKKGFCSTSGRGVLGAERSPSRLRRHEYTFNQGSGYQVALLYDYPAVISTARAVLTFPALELNLCPCMAEKRSSSVGEEQPNVLATFGSR